MPITIGGKGYGTFIGKEVVKVGIDFLYGEKVFLNIEDPHLILVVGKRGSGKSFTLGVIAENFGLEKENIRSQISLIIIDTMNIFSTLKVPNYSDLDTLAKWDLEPKRISVNEYLPKFSIRDFDLEDLIEFFEVKPNIDDIYYLYQLLQGKEELPNRLKVRYLELKKLFGESILPKILSPGIHIVRLGDYPLYIKRAITNLILRKAFYFRMKAREEEIRNEVSGIKERKYPLIWIMIDEAHEFLAKDVNSPVKDTLVRIIREGRGPGVSLVLATQQPNKLVDDALTQADIVIAHKLTHKEDIETVNTIMRNFIDIDLERYFAINLPNKSGAAVVLDDKSERVYPIQIRPRITYHGGGNAKLYID